MKKDMIKIGEELFSRKQGVINGLTGAKLGFLEAGKHLMVIKQKQLFKAEGNHVISFAYWVENEIGISKATAYQLIAVYETFGDLLVCPEYAGVDYSKATLLLPLVTKTSTLQDKEELLTMAQHQSVRGLKDNLLNHKGEIAGDQCDHPVDKQEAWNKCLICRRFWR